jgi:hypothetical protein
MARSSASTATPPKSPSHYVVDGSNIATEGRAMPSLKQLNDAVMAFIEEHPHSLITVVVDATFGHRIAKDEVDDFDQAVANNELVTPPAGAVGRGDAFVLTIAHKAKAGILSNDSFQEFHGDYPWLFEPGRLIGGKPVPHVGWVFVERLPVRGPRSRQSVKDAKHGATSKTAARLVRGSASALADQPLPVPTLPPPGPASSSKSKRGATTEAPEITTVAAAAAPANKTVNDLIPFLEFVEQHPVGTSCTVVVESYASHGAYARAGDVLVYLPLRLMGNPMPRSARSAVSIGEALAVVIAGYTPERRSIDAALPSAAEGLVAAPAQPALPAATKGRKRAQAAPAPPAPAEVPEVAASEEPTRKRAARPRKSVAPPATEAAAAVVEPRAEPSAPPAPARRTRKAAKAAVAAPPAAEPAPAKKAGKRSGSKRASRPADSPEPAELVDVAPIGDAPAVEAVEPAATRPARAKRASKQSPPVPPAEAPIRPAKKAPSRTRASKKAAS